MMQEQTATNPATGEKVVLRNGQWVPLGGGAPQPQQRGPLPSPPVLPDPAEAERLANDRERLRLQQEAADLRREAANRQDETHQRGMRGEPLSDKVRTDTESDMNIFVALENAASTFQDDFGGNILGGLENTAQAIIPVGTEGQRNWWSDFKRTDNQIRNQLFGSALSAQEKKAYEDTTISPSMRPEIIRENLARRAAIVRGALERRREFLLANGGRPEAINTLFGPLSEQQRNEAVDENTATPPPLGGLRNADGQMAGATRDNGSDRQDIAIAEDAARREDDPSLAGVRREYARRLAEGGSAGDLLKWLRSAGVPINQTLVDSIREQVKFRDENPAVPIEEYDTTQLDDRFVDQSTGERLIGAAANSAPGAYFVNAADAATGFTLDNIVGMTGGNAERARLAIGEVSRQSPVASTLGTVTGGVTAALGAEAGLAARGMAAGLPRVLAADTAYGTVAGAGMTDYAADGSPATIGDRARGAAIGAGAAATGSFVGDRVGRGIRSAARPASDDSVRALNNQNIPTTIGEQYGNSGRVGAAVRGIEDRIEGLPVVGDAVSARRSDAYRAFNTKAFDKALEPIGGKVGGKVGEDAVVSAQRQVSDAFTTALAGKQVSADVEFAKSLTTAMTRVARMPRVGEEVYSEIGEIMLPYANQKTLTGEALQEISEQLRALKHDYARDPLGRRVVQEVNRVERAVFDLFDRQASGTVDGYNKARQAYRRLAVLEDAVLRAKNKEGVFSTGQLGMADRTNSKRYDGRRGAARGEGVFHDYQRAAQNVLPNTVPDSGTAGRLILPAMLMGGGAGLDEFISENGHTALTVGAILGALYSRQGQRLLTKPGRGTTSQAGRALDSPTTQRTVSALGAGTGAASANALIGPR